MGAGARPAAGGRGVKVRLHHPRREVTLSGRRRVAQVLDELALSHEAYLVIRGDQLLTRDAEVADDDEIEIRPVVSGGAAGKVPCAA